MQCLVIIGSHTSRPKYDPYAHVSFCNPLTHIKMILVYSSALEVTLQSALMSLRCWVGIIVVWQHSAEGTVWAHDWATIDADSLESAMQEFARRHQRKPDLVITRDRAELVDVPSDGVLATEAGESEAHLRARVIHQLISICRVYCPEVVVGATIMKQSRQEALCRQGLLHLQPLQGVAYFPLDVEAPEDLQPRYDILIVKATDFLQRTVDHRGGLAVAVCAKLTKVMSRAQDNGVVVLDPVAALGSILDRRTLRHKLPDLQEMTHGAVAWSESLELPEHAASAELVPVRSMLQRSDGVLIKPCVACGIPESHDMCLVRAAEALPPQVEVYPCLVEAVHNHGGVVIKCYAIKGRLFMHAKPSLPDVAGPVVDGRPSATAGDETGCIRFHSLKNMPCAAPESIDQGITDEATVREAAEACAHVIAEKTGLALFGFDLVKPAALDHFLLIDVNAFPSFRGVPDAAEALRSFIKVSVHSRACPV
eukprot:jgi/Ulvmu1/8010/UM004_0246.1